MASVAPFAATRELGAPRELVFRLHTEPDHLLKWFGPAGSTVLTAAIDLRPGGIYHYGLCTPGGQELWGVQVFREIAPPERLVFVQSFSDDEGRVVRHPLAPTWPLQMLSTTTLEDLGSTGTRLTISWQPESASEEEVLTFDAARANMEQGFKGMLDSLEAYLHTLQA